MTARFALCLCLAAGLSALLISCALPTREVQERPASLAAQRTAHGHIAQIGFGQKATFMVCVEAACPMVTQKTLSVAPDGAASLLLPPTPAPDTTPVKAATENANSEPAVSLVVGEHKVSVFFGLGSAVLTPAGEATISQSLPIARRAERIDISGRTDSLGPLAPNQSLAFSRALAVRDFLRRRDPTLPATIVLKAQGRCCYIASNDTPQGRAHNRRVEVVFRLPEQGKP